MLSRSLVDLPSLLNSIDVVADNLEDFLTKIYNNEEV